MARKDRSIAGFGDVAGEKPNDMINHNNNHDTTTKNNNELVNNNDHVVNPTQNDHGSPEFIDTLIENAKKKDDDLIQMGLYIEPDLAKILNNLGKKGGRGAKSRIVNDALRKLFKEKKLMQ